MVFSHPKPILIVAAFGLPVFFLMASFFPLSGVSSGLAPRFNSPDETANFFFIKQFALTGHLKAPEPMNLIAPLVHPRSINVKGGELVPGSFIGLILIYGLLARLLGLWIIPYLTPFFATLGFGAFYLLVNRIFGRRVALISSFLWIIHPAIIYYSARGLLPNVLFVSLALVAAALLPQLAGNYSIEAGRFWPGLGSLLCGLFFAAALIVRPSELWLPLILLAVLLIARRSVGRSKLILFLLGCLIILVPFFYYQHDTYGSLLATGYDNLDRQAVQPTISAQPEASLKNYLRPYKPYLLPFGFNLSLARKNTYDYLLGLFWWLAIPAIYAIVWGVKNWHGLAKREKFYFLSGGVLFFWLVVYYGGGSFTDSTLSTSTIGTSYVRYWLPIYIWAIPLAAWMLSRFGRSLQFLYLGLAAILGLGLAFSFTPESLDAVRQNLLEYAQVNAAVSILTDRQPSPIIVSSRADKVFFPEFRVINFTAPGTSFSRDIGKLISSAPIYFYLMMSDQDISNLNHFNFSPFGWHLEIYRNFGQSRLYRAVKNEK